MPEYVCVKPRLDAWPLGRILRVESVESTNTVALEQREDGLAVLAETQTRGRGRRGNGWSSEPGRGIWCSICLEGPPEGLTFAAACALHEALEGTALKWPNDLLHGGKKLCGILVEHRAGWNALGFGINVLHRREDFPPELRDSATSLLLATGPEPDREEVFQKVLRHLAPRLLRLRAGGLRETHQEWNALLDLEGRRLRRDGIDGVVERINLDGSLVVATASGQTTISAGDVQWIED